MLIAALTGGIATGKSIVGNIFRQLGCVVFDADQVAHRMILPGHPGYEPIIAHFGEGILHKDRSIDRKKLGKIVFADEDERRFLNALLHPLIKKSRAAAIEKTRSDGQSRIFISEAALTIEAGYWRDYDRIIVTYCSPERQIRRLCKRDGIQREAAQKKVGAQMPAKEKLKYADYIIKTSGSFRDTLDQTAAVFRYLYMDSLWRFPIKRAPAKDQA